MKYVLVSIAASASMSTVSHGQIVPTSWERSAQGLVHADDYGWGPGSDDDAFSVSEPGLGAWATSSAATCSFGSVTENTASISQSSNVSTVQLQSAGTLHNSHNTMASSAETDTSSSHTYEVWFTLASPTPVQIAFSATQSYTNWASTDYYECTMYLSGPGIEEMAGYWPGPDLSQSYSYAGTLPAGNYFLLLTTAHGATSANDPAALDWKYTWDFEMNVVPGPGTVAICIAGTCLAALRRRSTVCTR